MPDGFTTISKLLDNDVRLEAPTVILEEDGDIGFEWYLSVDNLLSVSVSRTGGVAWASRINGVAHCGDVLSDVPSQLRLLAESAHA